MKDDGATKFIYVYATRSDDAEPIDPTHVADLEFWNLNDVSEMLEKRRDAFTETLPYVLATATPPAQP
jgi:hypothetical protein